MRWEWDAAFGGVWPGVKRRRVAAPRRIRRLHVGAAQCRGRRPYQEDRVVALQEYKLPCREDQSPASTSGYEASGNDTQRSYFGIFDGHSGEEVAAMAAGRMHSILAHTLASNPTPDAKKGDRGDRVSRALRRSFLKMDKELWRWSLMNWDERYLGGSCACVAYREGEDLYVANAGDCRAVISHNGTALPLSRDHKPDAPGERERLAAVGALTAQSKNTTYIVSRECASGLAVSRCLGDIHFKQLGYLTAEPDVSRTRLEAGHEFLVMACDGVWDVMTNQEAVNVVREFLRNVERTEEAVEAATAKLIEKALMKGSGDNLSAVVALIEWDK
eukprot:evm.model.scf_103EXC.10 EVM.evm.TU.scf_103EXC.10   scf_103EXC:119728-125923(-)